MKQTGIIVLSLMLCLHAGWALDVTPRAHAFYYPWYGNPETDGQWLQWNHAYPDGHYTPPESIGADYYPEIGLYSANDPETIHQHMRFLTQAGVGVISLSWWGEDTFTDNAAGQILDIAAEHGIQCNFHIEPFPGRNANTFKDAVIHLIDRFGEHPALYRDDSRSNRPLFYIYDSYLTPKEEWAEVLQAEGENTLRGTDYDCLAIGLWVKEDEQAFMLEGGFDGFYTYFATNGFTYGSTFANWPRLADWAKENGMLFIPSVGPGYIDTRIRPWNGKNTRSREDGAYYDREFKAAIKCEPEIISITSFNEWHEGTQIEPAAPKQIEGYEYEDYRPLAPDSYLDRTRHWLGVLDEALKR